MNNLLPFNIITYLYRIRYSISSREHCYVLRPCFTVKAKTKLITLINDVDGIYKKH